MRLQTIISILLIEFRGPYLIYLDLSSSSIPTPPPGAAAIGPGVAMPVLAPSVACGALPSAGISSLLPLRKPGIDGIDGMEGIAGIAGIDGMEGIDGIAGIEGMEALPSHPLALPNQPLFSCTKKKTQKNSTRIFKVTILFHEVRTCCYR